MSFPRLERHALVATTMLIVCTTVIAAHAFPLPLNVVDSGTATSVVESCVESGCAEGEEEMPPQQMVLLQTAFNARAGTSGRLASKVGAADVDVAGADAAESVTFAAPDVGKTMDEARKHTDLVHEQAWVVANASTGLREAKRRENKTDARLHDLEQADAIAEEKVKNFSAEVNNFSANLAAHKKKRDDIDNATKNAKRLLHELEAKNRTGYDDYFLFKGSAPEAKAALAKARQRADEIENRLNGTRPLTMSAHLEVKHRDDELQAAIAELNKRNDKLKKVEAQLPEVVVTTD